MYRNLIFSFAAGIFLLAPVTIFADESDSEISLLRQQLLALSERLDALESDNAKLKAANEKLALDSKETHDTVASVKAQTEHVAKELAGTRSSSSWADRISFKGDFRGRYENIDEEGKSARDRDRVRARASLIAKVNDQVEIGLGMASGGDDPVSTNQTLGNGGSTKGLNLDLAYFKWKTSDSMTVLGGKFKNPLFKPGKHGMLWDGDWNPEGIGFSWSENNIFVNGLGTWLESDSNKEAEFSYGLQAGLTKSFDDGVKLTAGAGYYSFNTSGKGSFYGDDDDFFGNSFNPLTNQYMYDYSQIEVFADLAFELNGQPAGLFVDYVTNTDADEFDTGYALGFKYGSAKNAGEWQWGYVFQDLERDATFALLADSDFAGGGTDGKGHIFKSGYAINKNINANITYFLTERNANAGSERDYDRLQVDLAFKY